MSSSQKLSRLYQAVAERLAKSIAAGDFKPGNRLPAERDLAELFDVSRTTIREAIIALEIQGMVDVRIGSGVYVSAARPRSKTPSIEMDIGAFELTESRLLVEGEVAALAAVNATPDDIADLERLLVEMDKANAKGDGSGELVDRQFHERIAICTRNSAMVAMVEQLWTIRNRSPQCVRLFDKSRNKGNQPVVNEHKAIVDALQSGDPAAARAAMRTHLSKVLDYLLDSSEVEAIEQAKAKIAEQRSRFGRRTSL
jgi:GntR family transcriptional regulator, hexuronate regulon transcriptional repressor